ncbi:SGNH/GDSL hydrolase family protein [Sphingobacterium sp. N143]|uniref:SGNH/GDSL hydrolase family protein n=1 Tax=Sphingobacterium sp. N143 TaxID=2746727 RepID=UPI002578C21C|nr:SGNH/GDSL hydrolase family protein [Sphingobacterium sp. N143]MDM1294732.1 SGNH/GDSL hydrolase family protein [Sphingobacterium sp. N143]
MSTNRRSFIKKSIIGAGLLTGANFMGNDVFAHENMAKSSKINLSDEDIILFQGDSITDVGRDRNNRNPNDTGALGHGYALLAASQLLNKYPEKKLKIHNTGISGNRVPDLQKRWEEDTLAFKPTILSILIGVNDFWRTIDRGAKTTVEEYKTQYQQLLQNTMQKLPDVKLIIGEPFAVKGVGHITEAWYPKFLAYQDAARDVAKEFNAILLPYQKVFDNAQKSAPGAYWAADGVHPTLAGAQMMASAWMECIK